MGEAFAISLGFASLSDKGIMRILARVMLLTLLAFVILGVGLWYALRLAESGTPVVDVCRQIGVSEATYYTRKKKYGDLGVTELRRLKMLEDENARLKRIVADLTLDKQILQDVVKKKL